MKRSAGRPGNGKPAKFNYAGALRISGCMMGNVAIPGRASTIIIARPDQAGGFELLMTRRSPAMRVLAGYLVFPGGGVEDGDWSQSMLGRCRGLSPARAREILATEMAPEQAIGHWVAAVRELFEEVGIHFFAPEENGQMKAISQGQAARLAAMRCALWRGGIRLAALLQAEDLYCDVGRLTYLFHRITPEHYPVRFDTRFYIAALPEGQLPLSASEEVAETLWLTPQEALAESESKRLPMMPPTLIALRTLARQESWQDLTSTYALQSQTPPAGASKCMF